MAEKDLLHVTLPSFMFKFLPRNPRGEACVFSLEKISIKKIYFASL
jgi:hypothetical protein